TIPQRWRAARSQLSPQSYLSFASVQEPKPHRQYLPPPSNQPLVHQAASGATTMAIPSFFGPEFLVNTTTAGLQSNPSITGLANGKFVAAWQDDSTTGAGGFASIRTQLYNADGSKLGGEFIVNGNELSNSIQPSVTALKDGRYVVAWTHLEANDGGDGSGTSVKARVFNADGSPAGNEFFINQVTALDQDSISIAALADGGLAASRA